MLWSACPSGEVPIAVKDPQRPRQERRRIVRAVRVLIGRSCRLAPFFEKKSSETLNLSSRQKGPWDIVSCARLFSIFKVSRKAVFVTPLTYFLDVPVCYTSSLQNNNNNKPKNEWMILKLFFFCKPFVNVRWLDGGLQGNKMAWCLIDPYLRFGWPSSDCWASLPSSSSSSFLFYACAPTRWWRWSFFLLLDVVYNWAFNFWYCLAEQHEVQDTPSQCSNHSEWWWRSRKKGSAWGSCFWHRRGFSSSSSFSCYCCCCCLLQQRHHLPRQSPNRPLPCPTRLLLRTDCCLLASQGCVGAVLEMLMLLLLVAAMVYDRVWFCREGICVIVHIYLLQMIKWQQVSGLILPLERSWAGAMFVASVVVVVECYAAYRPFSPFPLFPGPKPFCSSLPERPSGQVGLSLHGICRRAQI